MTECQMTECRTTECRTTERWTTECQTTERQTTERQTTECRTTERRTTICRTTGDWILQCQATGDWSMLNIEIWFGSVRLGSVSFTIFNIWRSTFSRSTFGFLLQYSTFVCLTFDRSTLGRSISNRRTLTSSPPPPYHENTVYPLPKRYWFKPMHSKNCISVYLLCAMQHMQ
jgi:hypothetical protein